MYIKYVGLQIPKRNTKGDSIAHQSIADSNLHKYGSLHQQKNNQNLNNNNTQSVKIVNNFQNRNRSTNFQRQIQHYNCIANASKQTGKKGNNCGILNQFAKKCRKPKNSQPQTSPTQQTNVNHIESTPNTINDEEPVNYITSDRDLYEEIYGSNYDSDSDNYVAAISKKNVIELKPLNAKTI